MTGERVQAPRTAWMNRMRAEVLRMRRLDVAKIVHVGWAIASFADSDGTNCHPGTDTIATIVGSGEETVSRAKKVLKALGVLTEKRRPNDNSEYLLHQPVGAAPLDWEAHLYLYTDTRSARRKKKEKEQELAAHLAKREAELAEQRNPVQNGVRNPVRNGDQDSRNPFPPGVPEGPDPVPAGGSEPPSQPPGTRSGTGSEPGAERVPEPVPAGGGQRVINKGPDKEGAGPGSWPSLSPGEGPERQIASEEGETQPPLLAAVPEPPRRTRRKTAPAGSTQPPLLISVPGQTPPTPDEIQQTVSELGVAGAMRRYGRDLVLRELNNADSQRPRAGARTVPAEWKVPCGYCEAPAETACRSSAGLRGVAHQGRLEAWNVAYAKCPRCEAAPEEQCTNSDGTPLYGIHAERADLGADMRQIADQQPQTETGT
ncbi:helix-turn-helix domain-containing protein [Streptomyces fagopyri]|uniref:zinc finger domain-containing protein n=1 Tax=Streptomyces fagopyri TaxID=2662397 RepID=UPI0036CD7449